MISNVVGCGKERCRGEVPNVQCSLSIRKRPGTTGFRGRADEKILESDCAECCTRQGSFRRKAKRNGTLGNN